MRNGSWKERERNKNSNKNHDILRWIEVTINKFKYPNFITYNSNKIEENDKKIYKKNYKTNLKKWKRTIITRIDAAPDLFEAVINEITTNEWKTNQKTKKLRNS